MSKHLFRRSLGLMLSAVLAVSALPVAASAAEAENADFTITELTAEDVTLDETEFEYTGNEIIPNVTVRVGETLLTLDQHYKLEYSNNVEVGEATVTVIGIATNGYSGRVDMPYYIGEKLPEYTLVEILSEHVSINGSEFPYTGEPIEPSVTVTIDGTTLTAGQDYAIEYVNNLVPGTGTVIVRGIATASETLGYSGEVRVNFTILPVEESYPLVEITREHVTIDGMEFPYTGQAIEPAITITIDGKVLTAGKDYSLKFEDNIQPGSAKAIISGIATATEEGGYTGTVTLNFTIRPQYAITAGDGAIWNRNSGKTLVFTANGQLGDFDYLTVDGKTVPAKYYTAKEGSTVITLKTNFLDLLPLGSHTITLHYVDGDASGTFRVAAEADDSNPKTGDTFPLHLLCAVMFISLTGLIGAAYAYRKDLWK